jgi:D-3-phosphoglycerate dehydrogenase
MNKKHHILIIDDVHPLFMSKLSGYSMEYVPDISEGVLWDAMQEATILVMRSKLNMTADWIDRAPKLKLIARLGSGMDNIDVDYATTQGIHCINAPEGNRNAVAEQAVGTMLTLLSNVYKGDREISQGVWDRKGNEGRELRNLTVGIIGYGNVGSRLAELLVGFGCEILAYDLYKNGFGYAQIKEVHLAELQDRSDIVTIHVPLTNNSQNMVNDEFIDKMKKSFLLLNLSRGAVVNISALINGIKSGKVLGVGLDVLPNEKLDTYTDEEQNNLSYLSDSKAVMISPHIGGITKDAYIMLAEVLADKILKWDIRLPLVN